MEFRAIPEGYMRVGELAKQAGVTVRTLQYYDKEGLLTPSAASEGGMRLYSDRDAVRLMQILTLKQMGFSLGEVKQRLTKLDTLVDVVQALSEQTAQITGQINTLTETLDALEKLKAEIEQMESVNFKKYVAILINLQMKNEHYWMVKHMDDELLNHFAQRISMQRAQELIAQMNHELVQAYRLHRKGVEPGSVTAQKFAKHYWEIVLEVTGGDANIIKKLAETFSQAGNNQPNQKFQAAQAFIAAALEHYLEGEYHGKH